MGPSESKLVVPTTASKLKYCRAQDVAAISFSGTVAYDGCKICTDPKSALYRTYVRNDQDCASAQINLYRYLGGEDGCGGGDEINYCAIGEKVLYEQNNASDCPDKNYQARKRVFSQTLRSCDRVLATTKRVCPADKAPALTCPADITLASMCPADVFTYLKCDPVSHQCTYKSTSGEDERVKACANSFAVCKDPEYLADKLVWEAFNADCKAKWDRQNLNDTWLPRISFGVYAVLLIAIVYSLVGAGAFSTTPVNNGNRPGTVGNSASGPLCTLKNNWGWLAFAVVAFLVGGLWMFSKHFDWIPSQTVENGVDVSFLNDNKKDEGDNSELIGGIVLSVIAGLAFVVLVVAFLASNCTQAGTPVSTFGNGLVSVQ